MDNWIKKEILIDKCIHYTLVKFGGNGKILRENLNKLSYTNISKLTDNDLKNLLK